MRHHLRLFGYPALLDEDGEPLPFKSRKQLALLVCLALDAREEPVSRQLLTAFFWPDVPPARAGHSLSQALGAIREKLGKDSVTHRGDPVLLLAPLRTDLDLLRERKELPGGYDEPLKGLELAGTPEFVSWVDIVRSRCVRAAREVLSEQLHAARTDGDAHRLHEHAAQLYRVDPLANSSVCGLAEQLLLEGDSAGSQRLLRSYLERAPADLGEDAVRDVTRLLRRVQKSIDRPPAEPDPLTRRALERRPEVFVSRTEELALLEQRWSESRLGKLVTCLVAGPAGIGKSTLLRRFAATVDKRTAPVVEIACQEIGRDIPFAAVSDLVHALSRDGAASGTEARWLAEASRVCPRLSSMYANIPDPPEAPAESVRFRVAEALLQMWDTVTEGGPGLVVIDDIPNLDQASRDVLYLFLRRLADRPTLLAAGSRMSLSTGSADGLGLPWQETIDLVPLDHEQTGLLLDLLVPEPGPCPQDARAIIIDLAGGNPFLIETLLWDYVGSSADSLVGVYSERGSTSADWRPTATMYRAFEHVYHGLSPQAELILNTLAVSGRDISPSELTTSAALPRCSCDTAILELLERGVVRLHDGGLRFKNALHRQFVYGAMPEPVRQLQHARWAEYLQSTSSIKDFQQLLEASHHFTRAERILEAANTVMSGAGIAISSGAAREAQNAVGAVLRVNDGCDSAGLRLLLAEALSGQGRFQEAASALASVTLSDLTPELAVWAATLRAEALHRGRLSDDATIQTAARGSLDLAFKHGSLAAQLRALQVSAEVASESADRSALDLVDIAARRIRDGDVPPIERGLATLSNAYCKLTSGRMADAEREFDQCVQLLRDTGRDSPLRKALNGLAIAQLARGAFELAATTFEEAARVAETFGDADAAANSWSNLAAVHEDLGRFAAAAASYAKAVDRAIATSGFRRLAELSINLSGFALVLGLVREANIFAARAEAYAKRAGQWRLLIDVLTARADCELAQGNDEAAWALLRDADAVSRDRVYLLADMGRYERLRRHHTWRTRGPMELRRLIESESLSDKCPQIGDSIEVRIFEEWATSQEGAVAPRPGPAVAQALKLGLVGVLSRLRSVGVEFSQLAETGATESNAPRASLVPLPPSREMEASISMCLSLAAQLHFDRTTLPALDRTAFPSSV